jgi:hypothetical protein
MFILLVAGPCAMDVERHCDPSLEQLLPAPGIFAEDASMSTPDRGVLVESGGHPIAVCDAVYYLHHGAAFLDLYVFDNSKMAETARQNLFDAAVSINPEFDVYVEPPSVSDAAPHADSLDITCDARVSRTVCTVVARYGFRVYWLSVSQQESATFTHDDLRRVIEVMDATLMSDNK